jgi:Papain-like cysteine protease AvrRpt2
MDILLDVPFVTQMKVGAHAGGTYYNDKTGCWYAAVCMLGYYRAPGPRLGVPEQYTKPAPVFNKDGVQTTDTQLTAEPMGQRYEQLKTNEHLVSVDLPGSKKWECGALCKILQEKGPCFVRRGFLKDGKLTGGHAIVLVGSKESTKKVIYHCPTKGPNLEMGIDEFNSVFKWNDSRAKDYSMMYLPG